ncbi:MAG: SIS domain-containing protein [Desulfobacteraceae bacterium]|jgi:glucosamine--fructose-6-phosphate aminotransferase (isomerizing)
MSPSHLIKNLVRSAKEMASTSICFGKVKQRNNRASLVLFPVSPSTLNCGLSGIVSYHKGDSKPETVDMEMLRRQLETIEKLSFSICSNRNLSLHDHYLGGPNLISEFREKTRDLNRDDLFIDIFFNVDTYLALSTMAERLQTLISVERESLEIQSGILPPKDVDVLTSRIETLLDIHWCLVKEIFSNIKKVKDLAKPIHDAPSKPMVMVFKKINSVLNAIDRLEVRGRDSAGLSLLFTLSKDQYETFKKKLTDETLASQLSKRTSGDVLLNNSISIHELKDENHVKRVGLGFAYKIAAEIGSLGDNVHFLRHSISIDPVLQVLASLPNLNHTVSAHTRWASVGAISESNCHPVDNETRASRTPKSGIIHVCLNGDIDNYIPLKDEYEDRYEKIQSEITTDTKIIPMQIERHLKTGCNLKTAFLKALNDFEGSHAISMHSDLDPGKLFLGQKGSGQAVFIGIAKNHFMAASEVYGFVEETPYFIKMDGEKIVDTPKGKSQGQLFILDQNKKDPASLVSGIEAMNYDGTPITLTDEDVKSTQITSRDIDRQNFSHYFLKEITESPVSVERTIRNRWKIKKDGDKEYYVTSLDSSVVPESIVTAFKNKTIRRVFFVGQGTAGVAALACSGIMNHYLHDSSIQVTAQKASEFSGFTINMDDGPASMTDTLVIAISQSGTTTDTNLAVDMVRERGAHTLAIVNRRDSDLTFKVNGVIYTSSGRDIEMSVASTKAFYSQIVAGTILGLHIAALTGKRDALFVSEEIKQILNLPDVMRKVLDLRETIKESADTYAVQKTYWAVVGSGYNKSSSDEIRIKLSELCYKTISSDFVEDKKHIDLSSEPLILVCAAGTRESVLGDIIKDTAIFNAHKALPIVIANQGEQRFAPYAKSVFHVPAVSEHLAPIVNTLAGHIWGYYAALSINEASRFLFNQREELANIIDRYAQKGMNVYEIFLENTFREKLTEFYNEFRKRSREKRIPAIIGFKAASDLSLILKYVSGKLPGSDFELDFTIKGTPLNMLDALFECLNLCINNLARPIDAIKHQAKTVTVGTSRISEKVEGFLFELLEKDGITLSQLTSSNILVLRNLQAVIDKINGYVLYRIDNLSLLGQATAATTIQVVKKEGVFKSIPSRVEVDNKLTGTKSIIVREGNVFIGKGLKDNKNILSIPIKSKNSNVIENILSLNVAFKDEKIPLFAKIKALGGKHVRISNLVQEQVGNWDDKFLQLLKLDELFGLSAEKIAERVSAEVNGKGH